MPAPEDLDGVAPLDGRGGPDFRHLGLLTAEAVRDAIRRKIVIVVMVVCLLSLGRPRTTRDQRAVELGLRTQRAAEVVRGFLDDVEPLRVEAGLVMPSLDRLGVELPEDLRARFATSGLHA